MRTTLLNTVLVLACVPRCFSQELYPRYFELSGGYSHATNGYGGWNASFVVKPRAWIGIAGDFSGYYAENDDWFTYDPSGLNPSVPIIYHLKTHSFLFGPRFYWMPESRFQPFTHILFGTARVDKTSSLGGNYRTESGFSWAAGGGVDLKVSNAVALRLLQADYFAVKEDHPTQPGRLRITAGIVVRFR